MYSTRDLLIVQLGFLRYSRHKKPLMNSLISHFAFPWCLSFENYQTHLLNFKEETILYTTGKASKWMLESIQRTKIYREASYLKIKRWLLKTVRIMMEWCSVSRDVIRIWLGSLKDKVISTFFNLTHLIVC